MRLLGLTYLSHHIKQGVEDGHLNYQSCHNYGGQCTMEFFPSEEDMKILPVGGLSTFLRFIQLPLKKTMK